jgi:hypothetical protein
LHDAYASVVSQRNTCTGRREGAVVPVSASAARRHCCAALGCRKMIPCIIILLCGGALLASCNRISLRLLVVLLVLLLQCLCFAWPRVSLHGPVIDEPYRNSERLEAHRAWMQHPSASTEAAYRREDELLSAHLGRRALTAVAVILVLDGAGLFYFWNRGKRTSAQLGTATHGGPAMRSVDSAASGGPPSVS